MCVCVCRSVVDELWCASSVGGWRVDDVGSVADGRWTSSVDLRTLTCCCTRYSLPHSKLSHTDTPQPPTARCHTACIRYNVLHCFRYNLV